MSKTNNQAGFAVPHFLLVILVIGLVTGTGVYVYKQNQSMKSKSLNSQETKAETPALPSDLSSVITLDKLKEIVTAENANNGIAQVELEQEDRGPVYKVVLADGTVLKYDSVTGKKIAGASEKEVAHEALPASFTTGIGFAKAREIALQQKPNGSITKIELAVESGKVVYSVRFSDKARVDVNAVSGDVVRTKPAETDKKQSESKASNNTSNNNKQSSGSGSSNSGSGSSNSGNSGSDDTKADDSSHSGSDDDTEKDDDSSHSGSGSQH